MMVLSKDKKKKNLSKAAKIINTIFSAIIIAIFVVALAAMIYLLVQFVGGKAPSLFGYRFYFVVTDSMNPTLKPTDMILSKVIKDNNDIEYLRDNISQGDVITYIGKIGQNSELITHRIIVKDGKDDIFFFDEDKNSWMFVAKGDNNVREDSAFPITAIQGVMIRKVGFISKLYNFISNKSGGFILILIPVVGILIPFIIRLIVVLKTPSEEEKKELTDEEKKLLEEEIARKAVQEFIEQQNENKNPPSDN